jgi:PadR family transcriptional regulator PadR
MIDKSATIGSYRKGLAPLLLLGLLSQRDMYGYELTHELQSQTNGVYSLMEGSLYPVLYKMVDAGYISDRKELVGKRMTRVYYHLEPAGEKHFEELLAEYRTTVNAVESIVKKS